MNNADLRKRLNFYAFILCFAVIPLIVVLGGYYYTQSQNRELFLKSKSKAISSFFTKLSMFADPQRFWCYMLRDNVTYKIANNGDQLQILKNAALTMKKVGDIYGFDYMAYHPTIGVIASLSADTLHGTDEDIKKALYFCWSRKCRRAHRPADDVQIALGKVFGPQFYVEEIDASDTENQEPALTWSDANNKRCLLWFEGIYDCLLIAFIRPERLEDADAIIAYLTRHGEELGGDFSFSLKNANNNHFWHGSLNASQSLEIEHAAEIYEKNSSMQIETEHFYVYPKFLRPGITVFGYFEKSLFASVKTSALWFVGIALISLMAIAITIYGWRILILQMRDTLSLKWKLGFLFFFANGLPLLVLGFIANDFLKTEKDDYIHRIMSEGTRFLQDFDEKYELETARCIIRKDKITNKLFSKEHIGDLNHEDAEELFWGISSDTWVCCLVASEGKTLFRNQDGNYGSTDLKRKRREMDKNTKTQLEFGKRIGSFFLNLVNNKPVNEKSATEIELMVETAVRKTLNSFTYEILDKRGSFLNIGYGQNVHPALMDTFSFEGHTDYDYFMLSTIRTKYYQLHYLEKAVPQVNRNDIGLKVVLWKNDNGYCPNITVTEELSEFKNRLTDYPLKEPVMINHGGVEYIAMGFNCKHITGYKIMGFYPMERVDERIRDRVKELIVIAVLSLLLTLALSLAIIRGFLTPLNEISNGAKAIEQKNFEHRLPELGRDEFGDMGRIFNNVMVDLEELSVAGTIQQQLLPTAPIKTGNFSLFGKSVAMGSLGGDYFDFLEMTDDKFAVALGDVAGHGVGAALIMAMAKAGLIHLEELWEQPQKLVSRLHELIFASKTKKQKKIMTFQYLYADGIKGTAIYSNAGACSPMIVRKSQNTVEELKLSGAALGAFKKGKFTETEVKFEVGDAIVFYTDGIVESKNKAGEVLGYDNLKLLFQRCWDSDSKIFYENIYQSYLEYIGGDEADAGDDLTMVVLVFNEPKTEPVVEQENKEEAVLQNNA